MLLGFFKEWKKEVSTPLSFTSRMTAFTFPPPSPSSSSVKHLLSQLPQLSSPCFHQRLHAVPPTPFGEVMGGTGRWGFLSAALAS